MLVIPLLLSGFLLVGPEGAGRSDPWIELFDGKSLDGWVAEGVKEYEKDGEKRPVWTAQNGKILCEGKGFGFLRYGRREFADFAFHVEFRMRPRSNSGIGIRTMAFDPERSRETRPSLYSYEIQLYDDAGQPPSNRSSGSLYRYVAPRVNATKPAGEWNTIDIECVGPRIKATMNGQPILDFDQTTRTDLKARPLKGFVCLQNHGGHLEFRDIRIREIKGTGR